MTRTAKVTMPETRYSNSWEAELTAEQIDALILRLQEARKSLEEKPVIFRPGDIYIRSYEDSPNHDWRVNLTGGSGTGMAHWPHWGRPGGTVVYICPEEWQYIGNLADLLAQGPILMGLTEQEALMTREFSESRRNKIFAAFDHYRAAQKKEEP